MDTSKAHFHRDMVSPHRNNIKSISLNRFTAAGKKKKKKSVPRDPESIPEMRSQCLIMMMTVFWDIAPCSRVVLFRRSKDAYYLHHRPVDEHIYNVRATAHACNIIFIVMSIPIEGFGSYYSI